MLDNGGVVSSHGMGRLLGVKAEGFRRSTEGSYREGHLNQTMRRSLQSPKLSTKAPGDEFGNEDFLAHGLSGVHGLDDVLFSGWVILGSLYPTP